MAEITIQIPEQNFELIRQAIGSILVLELAAQTETTDVGVWEERNTPFNQSELPSVNVVFDNAPYDNHNPKSRRGTNQYYIDVVTNAKNSDGNRADKKASLKAQRIAGIIGYILSSAEYYYLGFEPGVIASRWVESIRMGKLQQEDSRQTTVCRIVFNVICVETVGDIEGTPINSIISKVNINDTDKGHKFEIENT